MKPIDKYIIKDIYKIWDFVYIKRKSDKWVFYWKITNINQSYCQCWSKISIDYVVKCENLTICWWEKDISKNVNNLFDN